MAILETMDTKIDLIREQLDELAEAIKTRNNDALQEVPKKETAKDAVKKADAEKKAGKSKGKESSAPAESTASAQSSAAPPAVEQEIEEDESLDSLLGEDAPQLTAEEVANNCKKIMDKVADKKSFRTGFVEILNKKFNVDNVSKVPVEKLGELMAEIEKLGASIK